MLIKPSALGDVVHTLPVLKLLRRRFSKARITWMVATAFESLIRSHPDLTDTMPFDRRGLGDVNQGEDGLVRAADLAADLRDRQFDLVIDLQGLLRSGLIAWGTHAPVRIGFGYAREGAWLAYTHRVKRPTPSDTRWIAISTLLRHWAVVAARSSSISP